MGGSVDSLGRSNRRVIGLSPDGCVCQWLVSVAVSGLMGSQSRTHHLSCVQAHGGRHEGAQVQSVERVSLHLSMSL